MTNSTFQYHPFEVSFLGPKSEIKSAVIKNLMEGLKVKYSVGHLTFEEQCSIQTSTFQFTSQTQMDPTIRNILLQENDFLFCEDCTEESIPKILVNPTELSDDDSILAIITESDGSFPDTDIPVFHFQDIPSIQSVIEYHFLKQAKQTPLYGLVLAGGRSSRMKMDKALLVRDGYSHDNGITQGEYAYQILDALCDQTFISCRDGQWEDDPKGQSLLPLPKIADRFENVGPIGGILSAMIQHPNAAWWVIACDMPYLEKHTLQHLLHNRDPFRAATTFKGSEGFLAEPLCSIYEPKIRPRLFQFFGTQIRSPIKAFYYTDIQIVNPPKQKELFNWNTNPRNKMEVQL